MSPRRTKANAADMLRDGLGSWLDPTVQPALRSWLKLPKDTPIPLFHAPVVEGGLGVPFHEHVVPLMPAKCLSTSDESPDPVIAQDHIRS